MRRTFQARGGIDQFVDIGHLEPQVGQRFERLAAFDGLRQKNAVDAACACPGVGSSRFLGLFLFLTVMSCRVSCVTLMCSA